MIFGVGKKFIRTQNTAATQNCETNMEEPRESCNMHPEPQVVHVNPAFQTNVDPVIINNNLRETI